MMMGEPVKQGRPDPREQKGHPMPAMRGELVARDLHAATLGRDAHPPA